MAYKGKFMPKNTAKYLGDVTKITYRSGWELKFMMYLDGQPNVVGWSSEEIIVPYRSPIDNRIHRYFPDFLVRKKGPDGKIECLIVEIKPASQSKPPAPSTKITKRYINEVHTWGINSSKWKAADEYCNDRGWKFVVLTEKELNIKF
jgi:hypothetical protein